MYLAVSDLSGLFNGQGMILKPRMWARHKWMPRTLRIQQSGLCNFSPSRRVPSWLLLGSGTHANRNFSSRLGMPGARPNLIHTFPPPVAARFGRFA